MQSIMFRKSSILGNSIKSEKKSLNDNIFDSDEEMFGKTNT